MAIVLAYGEDVGITDINTTITNPNTTDINTNTTDTNNTNNTDATIDIANIDDFIVIESDEQIKLRSEHEADDAVAKAKNIEYLHHHTCQVHTFSPSIHLQKKLEKERQHKISQLKWQQKREEHFLKIKEENSISLEELEKNPPKDGDCYDYFYWMVECEERHRKKENDLLAICPVDQKLKMRECGRQNIPSMNGKTYRRKIHKNNFPLDFKKQSLLDPSQQKTSGEMVCSFEKLKATRFCQPFHSLKNRKWITIPLPSNIQSISTLFIVSRQKHDIIYQVKIKYHSRCRKWRPLGRFSGSEVCKISEQTTPIALSFRIRTKSGEKAQGIVDVIGRCIEEPTEMIKSNTSTIPNTITNNLPNCPDTCPDTSPDTLHNPMFETLSHLPPKNMTCFPKSRFKEVNKSQQNRLKRRQLNRSVFDDCKDWNRLDDDYDYHNDDN